jgi:hypothetical protein
MSIFVVLLSALAAIAVGIVCWGLLFIALGGFGLGGSAKGADIVFLLGPMVGLSYGVFRLFLGGRSLAATWLFAVLPLFATLHAFIGVTVVDSVSDTIQLGSVLVDIIIWCLIASGFNKVKPDARSLG